MDQITNFGIIEWAYLCDPTITKCGMLCWMVCMYQWRQRREMKLWSQSFEANGQNRNVKKVQVNFKAINTLHCTLNPIKFNRISTCKITREIWDKLKVTHEGTSQVKESKLALLSNQYEMFKCNLMRASHLGLTDILPLSINSTN